MADPIRQVVHCETVYESSAELQRAAMVQRAEIRYRKRSTILGITMIIAGVSGILIDVVQYTTLNKLDWSRFALWLWMFPTIFCIFAGTFTIPTGIFKNQGMYIVCTGLCSLSAAASGISALAVAMEFGDVGSYRDDKQSSHDFEYEKTKWESQHKIQVVLLSGRLVATIVALIASLAQTTWSCNMCCCIATASRIVYEPIVRVQKPSKSDSD